MEDDLFPGRKTSKVRALCLGERIDLRTLEMGRRMAVAPLVIRLQNEYELKERHLDLERKLSLIAQTAETLLDILRNERSLRVEWYIVILIILEILLTLYQMIFR